MKFILIINVKMLTFDTLNLKIPSILPISIFMSSFNFMLILVEHEKVLYHLLSIPSPLRDAGKVQDHSLTSRMAQPALSPFPK